MAATGTAVAVALVAGCASPGGEPDPAPSGIAAEYASELPDPGDDRLAGGEWGETFPGGAATWRLADGYEPARQGDPSDAVLEADSLSYRITVDGDQATAEAFDEFVDETIAAAESAGGEAAAVDVRMGDRDYVVLLQDLAEADQSVRSFILRDDAGTSYVVSFAAPHAMADVPPERVEEFHQVVASLEPMN